MKRIIFDVDNTLLKSKRDILNTYDEFIEKKNIIGITSREFFHVMGKYEEYDDYSNKEKVVEFINKELNLNLDLSDYDEILRIYDKKSSLIHEDTENILKELHKKYELVVLSNWYSDNQVNRLENAEILKYFKHVYGIDNLGSKPNIKTFKDASYPHDLKDCIIVGDSITFDVEVPHEIGMRAIYFNPNNNETKYESITSLDELLDIL